MEPEVYEADAEAKHSADIGMAADGACRKVYVPDQVKADEDTRRVSFTISTGALDRDNDTIKVEGWDLKNYLKNPVVLFAHRSDMLPVAKAVSVVKTGGALKATAEFPQPGVYPLADTVYDFLKSGFLRATSVGFRPKRDKSGQARVTWNEQRGGFDFEEQELLEFSVVPVPSNPEALMATAKDFAVGKASGLDLLPLHRALALAEAGTSQNWGIATDSKSTDAKLTFTSDAGRVLAETAAPEPDEEPEPAVEKAGRRLSAKTEASLRSAHKSASEAVEHLSSVLGQAEEELEDDKSPESVLFVTPSPEPKPGFQVNPDDVKAAVVAAVSEAVKSAINHARGRLD